MRGSSDDEDDDADDDTQIHRYIHTSYSGLKVSDPIMYYILHELSYIPYAIYVTKQLSFESERFRPHYVLYII